MHLARWPNLNSTNERNIYFNADTSKTCGKGCVAINNTVTTQRMRAWENETNAFLHGYFEWDWADCYREIISVRMPSSSSSSNLINISISPQDLEPKLNSRFYAVNLLSELDAPGEYYIENNTSSKSFGISQFDLHIIPPPSLMSQTPSQWNKGPIFGVKQNVVDLSHSHNLIFESISVKNGVVGILANNISSSTIRNVKVEFQSQNGILMTNSKDTALDSCSVTHTGCGAIRAHGGDAKTLTKGNLVVRDCNVTKFALYKRTYEAGIHFSGVSNMYTGNRITESPHNCILGGGNEADANSTAAVDCLFANNILDTCSYEAADTGAFYVCGQSGTAFVNRNNTIMNNTFKNIRNVVGTGVQSAGVQAIYLDDQMSGWIVERNRFVNCQIGSFIGGGRRNIVRDNYYEQCDTAQHLDNRGMNWENSATNCTSIGKPFSNLCNPGAAVWMASESPAASEWASRFPFMLTIGKDRLCMPAYNNISNNRFCNCKQFLDASLNDTESWGTYVSNNSEVYTC